MNTGASAFQDLVDWECYGCGRLNEHGLHIKSSWEGDDVVCRWQPRPFHMGLPGRLQGGVIATVVICHAVWTATATAYKAEQREIAEPMEFAYSTTSLTLDFVSPAPVDGELIVRSRVTAMAGDRATVSSSVTVDAKEVASAMTQHTRVALGP